MGTTFTEAELDAAMAELDPGGDGQVDFSEFKAYWVRDDAFSAHAIVTPRAGLLTMRIRVYGFVMCTKILASGALRTSILSRVVVC